MSDTTLPLTHVTGYHAPEGWQIRGDDELANPQTDKLSHHHDGQRVVANHGGLRSFQPCSDLRVKMVRRKFMPYGGYVLTPVRSDQQKWIHFEPSDAAGEWPDVWQWKLPRTQSEWQYGTFTGKVYVEDLAALVWAADAQIDEALQYRYLYTPPAPPKPRSVGPAESFDAVMETLINGIPGKADDQFHTLLPCRHLFPTGAFSCQICGMSAKELAAKNPRQIAPTDAWGDVSQPAPVSGVLENPTITRTTLSEALAEKAPNDSHPTNTKVQVFSSGGLGSSSKIPPYHLIPSHAMARLADRFQLGIKRRPQGTAWNAISDNQALLDDIDFAIDRCGHAMAHAMSLRDKLKARDVWAIGEDDDAAAIMWAGCFLAEVTNRLIQASKSDETIPEA